jgi:hypothetical protein
VQSELPNTPGSKRVLSCLPPRSSDELSTRRERLGTALLAPKSPAIHAHPKPHARTLQKHLVADALDDAPYIGAAAEFIAGLRIGSRIAGWLFETVARFRL